MHHEFPSAVPEIPVESVERAVAYYIKHLGFNLDWRSADDDIAGISKGHCRLFLTGRSFREANQNAAPAVIWLNLYSIEEVDELHELWRGSQAKILSPPESKPWNLHEFTASDLDGNLLRVFYDFTHDA